MTSNEITKKIVVPVLCSFDMNVESSWNVRDESVKPANPKFGVLVDNERHKFVAEQIGMGQIQCIENHALHGTNILTLAFRACLNILRRSGDTERTIIFIGHFVRCMQVSSAHSTFVIPLPFGEIVVKSSSMSDLSNNWSC
jgi:hypothetical protein